MLQHAWLSLLSTPPWLPILCITWARDFPCHPLSPTHSFWHEEQINQTIQQIEMVKRAVQNTIQLPNRQMKALLAGNQLAALQVQEGRKFRELMVTKVQSDLASQMKTEKYDEWMTEQWRKATNTDGLDAPDRRNESLSLTMK